MDMTPISIQTPKAVASTSDYIIQSIKQVVLIMQNIIDEHREVKESRDNEDQGDKVE
jgi:hypothetical protein